MTGNTGKNKTMKCSKCRNAAINGIEYAGKHYCGRHFLEITERRVRKNLRVNAALDVKKKYKILDDGSPEFRLTKHFLDKIFGRRLKLEDVKTKPKNPQNVIIPTNLDEQAMFFLDGFLQGRKEKNSAGKNRELMPLEVLLQKEVEILCGILKIRFVPRVKKDLLQDLEMRHPGTKFSLFKSKQNLKKML